MNICKREFESKRTERKTDELCRDQQLIRLRCTAADVISEVHEELASVQHPEDLKVIIDRFRARLEVCEYATLVHALECRFGVAFARQAGLPVGRPVLRIAG